VARLGRETIVVRRLVFGGLLAASLAFCMAFASFPAAAAQSEYVDVVFDFVDAQESYAPGENFTVDIAVTNSYVNNTMNIYTVEVTEILAYFSWMGPNEWNTTNVSAQSKALYPGEMESFTLNYQVPDGAAEKTYSYKFKVYYALTSSAWGEMGVQFTETLLYRDFAVALPEPIIDGEIDYVPYLVAALVVVVVGAAGAFLYYRRKRPSPEAPSVSNGQAMGMAKAPATSSSELPIIHATPGERFPIERGFVYLVKEKRPGIAFAMFNEAVNRGAKGMLVTREHPNRLKQSHEFSAAKILWLTRRVGEDHIDPTDLSHLSMNISKFIEATKKSVVLLEGLEYLITQNNFETVLRFVNHMHDFVLAHDCAIIIVLDPRVLSMREIALLERSAKIVEPGDLGVVRSERLVETIGSK